MCSRNDCSAGVGIVRDVLYKRLQRSSRCRNDVGLTVRNHRDEVLVHVPARLHHHGEHLRHCSGIRNDACRVTDDAQGGNKRENEGTRRRLQLRRADEAEESGLQHAINHPRTETWLEEGVKTCAAHAPEGPELVEEKISSLRNEDRCESILPAAIYDTTRRRRASRS